jgi:hypothetical protein
VSIKSLKDWLAEGEQLYGQALGEYRNLESQLDQLEQALSVKREEVNQIAQVIGKPALENARRLSAELVESTSAPGVMGSVTRALTGRGLGRG